MADEIKDLESLMNDIAAVDSASAAVSSEEGDFEDIMPEMDEIEETVPEVKSNVEEEKETDVVVDYKSARNHVHWLMKANQTMIVNNARLANTTTHPKNFEAHQKMTETQLKLCEALIKISGILDEGKVKARITRSNKILEEDEISDDSIEGSSSGEKVKIERRPTQSALFEAVTASREVENKTGKTLTRDQITELAFKIDEGNITDIEQED